MATSRLEAVAMATSQSEVVTLATSHLGVVAVATNRMEVEVVRAAHRHVSRREPTMAAGYGHPLGRARCEDIVLKYPPG